MHFLLLTKTPWNETPRLRHQLAGMLTARGHRVTFVEKNGPPGTRRRDEIGLMELVRHGELLHHQLRVTRGLSWLNARYELREMRDVLRIDDETVIINFCYDYYFVRQLCSQNTVITVLNDDFVAGANVLRRPAAAREQAQTVRASDHVLVVSHPLRDQVRAVSDAVSTFFPWARSSYRRPTPGKDRSELLYWGYLNDRISWAVLRGLLDANVVINFAGPVDHSPESRAILGHPRARYHGTATLADLTSVIDRCGASILPYTTDARYGTMVAAITINNRAFELLAAGLPLLYADLPGLLSAPPQVIARCGTVDDYIQAFAAARKGFDANQSLIETFVKQHTEDARYAQLMELISSIQSSRGPASRALASNGDRVPTSLDRSA